MVSSSTPGDSSTRPTQGAFPGRRISSVTSFPAVQFNKAYPSPHAHSLRTQLRAVRDKPYSLQVKNGVSMRALTSLLIPTLITGCALKTPFSATATADGKYWVLNEPLIYEHPKTKQIFEVPRGFVTDMASVPRLFWTAFPPCGKYTPAAVVHDYIYWHQPSNCNRECADNLLLIAMEESGVSFASRNAIFAGVRVGGESSWEENARLRKGGTIRFVPDEHMKFSPYDSWPDIEKRIKSKNKNASAKQPEAEHFGPADSSTASLSAYR